MSRLPGDRLRSRRRELVAAWSARAQDARVRRLVREELDVIVDRVEGDAARRTGRG